MAQGDRGCTDEKGAASKVKREPCPDCFQCQGCSEERCRVCRKQGHSAAPTLATGFTYGEYLAWRQGRPNLETPGDGRSST